MGSLKFNTKGTIWGDAAIERRDKKFMEATKSYSHQYAKVVGRNVRKDKSDYFKIHSALRLIRWYKCILVILSDIDNSTHDWNS